MATRWFPHRDTTVRSAGLLALAVLLLAACGDGFASGGSTTVGATMVGTSSPQGTSRTSTLTIVTSDDTPASELSGIIESASATLAERLGVSASSLEVVVAERVTWPDGSLGCDDLDIPYTLDPVEGYRVVLGHEGRLYHYHVGSDAVPKPCESLTRRSDGPGSPEPSIPPPIK